METILHGVTMAFDILKLTSLLMDAICKKAREAVQSENEVNFQMESAARAATVKKTVFNMMDAARYQGNINWDAVKASGKVDCVLLKTVSTNSKFSKRKDGLYIDPTFERNYAECKRVGLPVGVYYYTYATTKAMADAELAVLKTALAGKTFEMGYIDTDGLDNVGVIYRAYHGLKGNGTGTNLYKRICALPIKEGDEPRPELP